MTSAVQFDCKPEIREIDTSTAHFAEAAHFGGKPHNWPEWLCGIFHKRHFISCWSPATGWGSHVSCGYCQKCRHFTNEKLRYNWLPDTEKPHVFHIRAWPSQSEIQTNELYLSEILAVIEMLATYEPDLPKTEYGEFRIVLSSRNSGHSCKTEINTLDARLRREVLGHLLTIYRRALEGDCVIEAEQRWWHKITG